MVSFQQLCEAVGEPQPASSQDELRKEVERLRLEVELASRGIVIDEGDVEVDVQLPPYVAFVVVKTLARTHTRP